MIENWTKWTTVALDAAKESGLGGVGWFVALYTLSCMFFLPGSALTLGAGAIYGFWKGTLLVTFSSTFGAIANFLTARYLLRQSFRHWFAESPQFLALDRAIEREGWKVIFVSRVSPVVPHSLVSYAAGLTAISFLRYTFASFIGFVPISAAYSYAGAFLGALARTQSQSGVFSPFLLTAYSLGLLATISATILTARLAKRALRNAELNESDMQNS